MGDLRLRARGLSGKKHSGVSSDTLACSRRDFLFNFAASFVDSFAADLGESFGGNLSKDLVIDYLLNDWYLWAHNFQLPFYALNYHDDWRVWLFMGGRGSGKTRAGAEWLKAHILGYPPVSSLFWRDSLGSSGGRLALVGASYHDIREVMIFGESGLSNLSWPSGCRPRYEVSRRRLLFDNGLVAECFSAEDPESLRGPQVALAWCDELIKWSNIEMTWHMLQFAMRVGVNPRVCVTTTPKPNALLSSLIKHPGTIVTHATTFDNAENLSSRFLDFIDESYCDLSLGKQEVMGILFDKGEDRLFSPELFDRSKVGGKFFGNDRGSNDSGVDFSGSLVGRDYLDGKSLVKIVVGVDPPAGGEASCCGIVAVAHYDDDKYEVLEDASISGSPQVWVNRALSCYNRWSADLLVVEINHGGDMIESLFNSYGSGCHIRTVRASSSKWQRAEPVAYLYTKGKVSHRVSFDELEYECLNFTRDGKVRGRSPDRLDALVWALSFCAFQPKFNPQIRRF